MSTDTRSKMWCQLLIILLIAFTNNANKTDLENKEDVTPQQLTEKAEDKKSADVTLSRVNNKREGEKTSSDWSEVDEDSRSLEVPYNPVFANGSNILADRHWLTDWYTQPDKLLRLLFALILFIFFGNILRHLCYTRYT